ncbi:MAG: porin [Gammaproteobacteria bacterium]
MYSFSDRQNRRDVASRRALAGAFALLVAIPAVPYAQVRLSSGDTGIAIEGFVNATTSTDLSAADPTSVAAGLRALARTRLREGPEVGVRIAAASIDSDVRLSEASVLLFGGGGRLEIGQRMGLPDVLTGYAPNNFTFTGAEFGPASGPSLDPAGGLQTTFLDGPLAPQVNALGTLGFAATLFEDESAKILYVTPKRRGLLGGLSYAPDADDPRYAQLVQIGLTHERYWAQNVLRWGGSYSFARGESTGGAPTFDDLHSANLGVTVTLDDALMLGASVTHNGESGLPSGLSGESSAAWGMTTSVNYNHGPGCTARGSVTTLRMRAVLARWMATATFSSWACA